MLDAAVVAARIVQFLAAMMLFGTPLFLLYGLKPPLAAVPGAARPLLAICAGALAIAALAALMAQTAVMAADPAAAFDRETLASVVAGSAFGMAIVVRSLAAIAALIAAVSLRPGRGAWSVLAALGSVILTSFAWSGHGAAEEGASGWIHAVADIVHLLAAGVWLGALAGLAMLLSQTGQRGAPAAWRVLHDGLAAFSGIGAAVVAAIVASGLVNSWFLVGPAHIWAMGASPYGQLLLLKLALFAAMLGLATVNRYLLTPALARGLTAGDAGAALASLRRSIAVETAAGALVLALVGVLGTLQPLTAQ